MQNSETFAVKKRKLIRNLKSQMPQLFPEIKMFQIKTNAKYRNIKPDITAEVEVGTTRKRIIIEAKSVGEPRFLSQAILQLKSYVSIIKNIYPIIVAPYISERGRQICKENNVGFIDLAGNCYLRFNNVLIEKTGKNNIKKEKKVLRKLFSPKSTRIIRTLLQQPKKDWTLKDLSTSSNISIGQAYKVVEALESNEYIRKTKERKIELTKAGELLDAWANSYAFSKNKTYTYYSFEKNPTRLMQKISNTAKQHKLKYAMTMHSGASLIAPFVRFTDVYFYFMGDVEEWVERLGLKPVEFGGTVHLMEPFDEGVFYRWQTVNNLQVVSNIQLYIDLYNYPTRGREQAEFLRKEKIGY